MTVATYERRKERDRARNVEESRTGRDIAPGYPGPGDLQARADCERDFRLFCEWYFPNAFHLAWSEDHLRVIARMQDVILGGGLLALAMPRGSGKSTLSIRAAIWALLYGHRRFVCLIAATEKLACGLLDQLKTELTFNERLGADFRQACYPLVRLENNGRKAIGQLFRGEQTRIGWSDDRLTLPTVPDDACDGPNVSGSTVTVAGLTGALRGQSHTLASGTILRPEFVILDDPQTRESATSAVQCDRRAEIVQGDVLGMAGPGREIAAVMPCTVVREGDMAAVMLDRKKNPDWSGQKTKMVYSFPTAEGLWEEYARIRGECLAADRGTGEATAFYAANRAAMDEGSRVAWPERRYPDELSALQHAMNLKIRNERAFFAEYQNDPLSLTDPRPDVLTPDQVAAKVNRMRRGAVAVGCNRLTAFVDVQAKLLYYAVCAWEDDFSGYVVDYGTFPDQKRPYFTLGEATHTLAAATKAPDLEGQIYQGLDALCSALCTASWPRDDGADLKVERLLIDANWGQSTAVIKKFCRQSAHSATLTPSHGHGVQAGHSPMAQWPKRPGEKVGLNWRLRTMQDDRGVRSLVYDTNFWKSFVHTRLCVPMGSKSCLSLFGDKPEAHRMFADHVCAEYPTETYGRGRRVDQWALRAETRENHWLDALTGCAVAASMLGVALADPQGVAPPPARKRVTFAGLARKKGA